MDSAFHVKLSDAKEMLNNYDLLGVSLRPDDVAVLFCERSLS